MREDPIQRTKESKAFTAVVVTVLMFFGINRSLLNMRILLSNPNQNVLKQGRENYRRMEKLRTPGL